MKRFILPCLLSLSLAGCGNSGNDAAPNIATPSTAALDMRVTAEIETGVQVTRVSIIPNDVAQWLSQILMISADGQLYRTALDNGAAKPVNTKAIDVVGLMRRRAAGVALLLTPQGRLSALIESDNEGSLAPLPVSAPPLNLSGFCQTPQAPLKTLTARTADGAIVTLAIEYEGDSQIILRETARTKSNLDLRDCIKTDSALLAVTDQGLMDMGSGEPVMDTIPPSPHQIGVLQTENGLSVITADSAPLSITVSGIGGQTVAISITDGLSIAGIQQSAAVHATTDSLGGTFSQGAIIMADFDRPRLILISREFALKTLTP